MPLQATNLCIPSVCSQDAADAFTAEFFARVAARVGSVQDKKKARVFTTQPGTGAAFFALAQREKEGSAIEQLQAFLRDSGHPQAVVTAEKQPQESEGYALWGGCVKPPQLVSYRAAGLVPYRLVCDASGAPVDVQLLIGAEVRDAGDVPCLNTLSGRREMLDASGPASTAAREFYEETGCLGEPAAVVSALAAALNGEAGAAAATVPAAKATEAADELAAALAGLTIATAPPPTPATPATIAAPKEDTCHSAPDTCVLYIPSAKMVMYLAPWALVKGAFGDSLPADEAEAATAFIEAHAARRDAVRARSDTPDVMDALHWVPLSQLAPQDARSAAGLALRPALAGTVLRDASGKPTAPVGKFFAAFGLLASPRFMGAVASLVHGQPAAASLKLVRGGGSGSGSGGGGGGSDGGGSHGGHGGPSSTGGRGAGRGGSGRGRGRGGGRGGHPHANSSHEAGIADGVAPAGGEAPRGGSRGGRGRGGRHRGGGHGGGSPPAGGDM